MSGIEIAGAPGKIEYKNITIGSDAMKVVNNDLITEADLKAPEMDVAPGYMVCRKLELERMEGSVLALPDNASVARRTDYFLVVKIALPEDATGFMRDIRTGDVIVSAAYVGSSLNWFGDYYLMLDITTEVRGVIQRESEAGRRVYRQYRVARNKDE